MSAPEPTCCGLPLGADGRCQHRPSHTTRIVRPVGWPGDTGCPHLEVECGTCGWGGTPEDLQLSATRCCQGCPDCMGIGSREQIKGMLADIRKVVAMCEEFETSGRLGALAGYRHSTAIRDVLTEYWARPPVDDHDHLWQVLRSAPPSWRCYYCGEKTEERPR